MADNTKDRLEELRATTKPETVSAGHLGGYVRMPDVPISLREWALTTIEQQQAALQLAEEALKAWGNLGYIAPERRANPERAAMELYDKALTAIKNLKNPDKNQS